MRTFLLLGAAASLAMTAYAAPPAEQAKKPQGISEGPVAGQAAAAAGRPQIGAWGFDEAGMERSIAPGDDFYGFANGTWGKTTPIPADRASYGAFTVLDDLSTERSHGILEEAAKDPASKIGNLYASFMDEATVENRGFDPVRPALGAVKAVATRADLARVLGQSLRNGVKGPIGGGVGLDDKDPDRPTIGIGQAGLGLPDRDYYLKDDPALVKQRAAYRDYVAQLLTLMGEPNAAPRAQAILDFETQVAQAHWTRVDSRDATKTYNVWSRADLDAKAPGFDWAAFLAASGLDRDSRYVVAQPSAVTASVLSLIAKKRPLGMLVSWEDE